MRSGIWLEPFVPSARHGGRLRTADARLVVNAIFYLLRTGCQWRQLHRGLGYPPWQTCYRYYAEWRRSGVWRKLHQSLLWQIRDKAGRDIHPAALVIDSQSVKSSNMASETGCDGGKRVKGRKQHTVVDSDDTLVKAAIAAANRHDTHGAKHALRKIALRLGKDQIKAVFADKGYGGKPSGVWVQRHLGATVYVGNNPAQIAKQFIPEHKRWVIERTFAWLSACRQLAKDYERDARNCITMIRIAFIRLLVRRLTEA